jgi:hypothetical protein
MSNYHPDSTSAVDGLFVVWSCIPPLILHYAFEDNHSLRLAWHMSNVGLGKLGSPSLPPLPCSLADWSDF